jgi:hypothetical protein
MFNVRICAFILTCVLVYTKMWFSSLRPEKGIHLTHKFGTFEVADFEGSSA